MCNTKDLANLDKMYHHVTLVNKEEVTPIEGNSKLRRLVLFEGEVAKTLNEANQEDGFVCIYNDEVEGKERFEIYEEEPRTK
jgi:hypothetical protein